MRAIHLALMFCTTLAFAACTGDGTGDKDSDTDAPGDDDDDTTMGDDDDDTTGSVPIVECTDAFDPCGGDPVGTWNVQEVCNVELDLSALNCGQASYTITDDRSSGTITLDPVGLYDRAYTIDLDFELTMPESCLVGPVNCGNLAMLSQGLLDACQPAGTDCVCDGGFSGSDAYIGTYVIEGGNTIVTDGNDRTLFCVGGNYAQSMEEGTTDRVHWER